MTLAKILSQQELELTTNNPTGGKRIRLPRNRHVHVPSYEVDYLDKKHRLVVQPNPAAITDGNYFMRRYRTKRRINRDFIIPAENTTDPIRKEIQEE